MQIQVDLGELNAGDATTVVVIRYRLNFNEKTSKTQQNANVTATIAMIV